MASAPAALDLVGYVLDVGQATDVAIDVQSGVAYVASMQFGLAAVDITNPARPTVLSTASPAFYADHVAVDGSVAVVVSGSSGLTVIDVSNPRVQPLRPVGYLLGTFRGVTVVGSTAYVIQTVAGNPAHSDLVVVDLSNVAAPNIIGRVTVGASDFVGVRVVGSIAYVTAGSTGLRIVDVSNRTAPRIIGTVAMPGAAQSVDVVDGYAYVAASTAMVVVDVRTPNQPVVKGSIAATVTNVIAANNTVYALGDYQFQLFDVSAPGAPRLLKTMSSYGAQGLDMRGNQVYLASPEVSSVPGVWSKGGLYVVDVASPFEPYVITNVYNGFDSKGIATDGRLVVATGSSWGLRVLDASNTGAPVIVGQMAGTFGAVGMTPSRVYVLQTVPGNPAHVDLVALDIGVPSRPSVLGRVTMNGGSALDVKVLGTLAYVAASNGGLQIVDLSTPSSLRIIGSVTMPYAAATVDVGTAGYAYVGTSGGVYVVDVRTATSPKIVGSIATAASAVAAANQLVYALDGKQLKVIDTTIPNAPVQVAALNGVSAQDIVAAGNWVVLATPALSHTDTSGGVYLVDVSEPTQPAIIDQAIIPGTTRSVTVFDNMVYAGDGASTLDILRINPTGPVSTPTRTATPTPIRTPTPTRTTVLPATATPAGVAGLIHYFSSATLGVSGTWVQLTNLSVGGGAAQTNATGPTGQFAFPGIGGSNWQIQPYKTGATNNPADVNDAVAVLEAVVGLRTLGTEQQFACDVSGDGYVDVNDATVILQYVVGLIPRFPVAQACNSDWVFIPEAGIVPNQEVTNPQIATTYCQPHGSITFRPLAGQANNQNFSGVLFGDCLGRWQPDAGRAAAMSVGSQKTAAIRVGRYQRRSGRRLLVPLNIAGGLRGFSAQLHYDSSQLAVIGVRPVVKSGGVLTQTNLGTLGVLNVAAASLQPLPRGQALMIEFVVKNRSVGATTVRLESAAVIH
ncbi:MAG: hypothetical protein U0587_05455 [Candidatus Binatia bacterium]